jgi:hypothetical protein
MLLSIIPEKHMAEIAAAVPPGVDSFLLTCAQDAAAVINQHRRRPALFNFAIGWRLEATKNSIEH